MVVMDSFALPVEGTETRVNAQAQGYEYMTEYIEAAKKVIREAHFIMCSQFLIRGIRQKNHVDPRENM